MRVNFYAVFSITPQGQITPNVTVHINGVTLTPGVFFGGGVSFGGVDLSQLVNRDLEVTKGPDGSVTIVGTY